MKLTPTTIVARLAFYLGILSLGSSALTLSFPDWQRYGITAAALLKLADTFLLVSIAMILAAGQEKKEKEMD